MSTTYTTADLDRFHPMPTGFIEAGMVVVDMQHARHQASYAAQRSRRNHIATLPVQAWRINRCERFPMPAPDVEGSSVWLIELVDIDDTDKRHIFHAGGSPSGIFAGLVLEDVRH